jgi:hypothetical protein
MADLPSSAPVSSVGSQSGGGGGVSSGGGGSYQSAPAQVINLPDNLQSISQNVTLGARLVGTNTDGSVVLSTAQGNVTLQSPFPLQTNTPVQIQFQPGNPPTAILILAVSGNTSGQNSNIGQAVINDISSFEFNTLSQLLSSTGAGASTLQQGGSVAALVIGNMPEAVTPQSNPVLTGGAAVQASALADALENTASETNSFNNNNISEQIKLLSQFGAPGSLPGQVGQLSLSGKLLTTVQQTLQQLQLQPGGNLTGGDNASALKVLLQLGQGGAGAGAAASPAALPSQQALLANLTAGAGLPPGTPLTLKILEIIPPGQSLPPSGATAPQLPPGALPAAAQAQQQASPTIITGQISTQTINNLPLLQTPQGTLVLQTADKLPPGTTLVLELTPSAQQQAATGQAAAALDASKTNPAAPKLEQVLQLLAEVDNQTFQLLMNSMPRLNGNFPPTALFFLQALRTGDIQNWLGDKGVQALRRAGPAGMQLLGELEEEFKTAAGRADSAKPGEWRVATIPYLGEYGIGNMQFGVRNHFQDINPDERRKFNLTDDAGRVTRFIFDIQFSELGPMQIDGLLRPRMDYQKQLDILVRTREMLPNDMRRDLRDLFSESIGAYGMNGVLTFQAGYQNWISLTGRQSGQGAYTRA